MLAGCGTCHVSASVFCFVSCFTVIPFVWWLCRQHRFLCVRLSLILSFFSPALTSLHPCCMWLPQGIKGQPGEKVSPHFPLCPSAPAFASTPVDSWGPFRGPQLSPPAGVRAKQSCQLVLLCAPSLSWPSFLIASTPSGRVLGFLG